jgi:hypothetical protein
MGLSTVVTTALHVAGIAVVAVKLTVVALVVVQLSYRALRGFGRALVAVGGHMGAAAHGRAQVDGPRHVMVGTFMAFPAVWIIASVATVVRAVREPPHPAENPQPVVEADAKTLAA